MTESPKFASADAYAERFDWPLQGRVIVIDNGARLAQRDGFTKLMQLNSFAVISFDPANKLDDQETLQDLEEFQLVPNAVLGSGAPATLYACVDNDMSGTLEPIQQTSDELQELGLEQVLARLPVTTIKLDSIEGLNSIDWLLLDHLNDSLAILDNGQQSLRDTLLIQVRIPFQMTHRDQPDFALVSHWMARHGFRFYRFSDIRYRSQLPTSMALDKTISTEMLAADAVFVPTEERLSEMASDRLMKLSFLMHTAFQAHDYAYDILRRSDEAMAKRYLIAEGYLWNTEEHETSFLLTEEYSPDYWADR